MKKIKICYPAVDISDDYSLKTTILENSIFSAILSGATVGDCDNISGVVNENDPIIGFELFPPSEYCRRFLNQTSVSNDKFHLKYEDEYVLTDGNRKYYISDELFEKNVAKLFYDYSKNRNDGEYRYLPVVFPIIDNIKKKIYLQILPVNNKYCSSSYGWEFAKTEEDKTIYSYSIREVLNKEDLHNFPETYEEQMTKYFKEVNASIQDNYFAKKYKYNDFVCKGYPIFNNNAFIEHNLFETIDRNLGTTMENIMFNNDVKYILENCYEYGDDVANIPLLPAILLIKDKQKRDIVLNLFNDPFTNFQYKHNGDILTYYKYNNEYIIESFSCIDYDRIVDSDGLIDAINKFFDNLIENNKLEKFHNDALRTGLNYYNLKALI